MGQQEQLIEYIAQDIVDMFSSDQDIEYDEAMNKFITQKSLKNFRIKKLVYIWKVQNMCMTFLKMG